MPRNNYLHNLALANRETFKINNSTIFYSLVNPAFLFFYQRKIRYSQLWLDGYDPNFHKGDMFCTRLGTKIFNGLTNSVFGRGLVFLKAKGNTENNNRALDFVSHLWSVKADFQNQVKRAISFCLPLGTSALKLNNGFDHEGLWCESLRMDNFYFSVNGKKELETFTTFIRNFQSTDTKKENYFLVEHRYFEMVKTTETIKLGTNGEKSFQLEVGQKKPMVEYRIYHYAGSTTNNTMPSYVDDRSYVNYKQLPDYVKDELRKDYGIIKIGEPQPLPFYQDLGVVLFFNEGGDMTESTLPFGRTMIYDIISELQAYDLNFSSQMRDLYNAKGVVGLPKALTQSQLTGGKMDLYQNGLEDTMANMPSYEFVSGLDPQTQKPVITQFEMRVAEHSTLNDTLLKQMATSIGVNAKVLGSYLIQGGEKTAEQISSEDDNITQWVKNHRQDYIRALNHIVELVLNFYGFAENIEVRFANEGTINTERQLALIKQKLDMGLIDIEDAVRELNPDLDETQLKIKIEKAQGLEKQRKEALESQADSFFNAETGEFNV